MSTMPRTDMTSSREAQRQGPREPQPRTAPTGTPLTRNEALVLSTLEEAGAPLKAYELLGQLKAQGVKAPMTVYRALDRLEGRGMVHKLDGLGAFVVCQHGEPHAMQAFLVCDGCAGVSEVVSQRTVPLDREVIERVATDSGFTASSARLEIRGHCKDCS